MRPEGIEVIENNDVYDYDEKGALVTALVNDEECAFVYFHENGTALCAIEKAYLEGKIDFWKPISCHLYPIRLEEKNGFIHVNYHEWSVCVASNATFTFATCKMTAKTSIDELVRNYYIIYYYHAGKDNKKVNKLTRLHDNKFF